MSAKKNDFTSGLGRRNPLRAIVKLALVLLIAASLMLAVLTGCNGGREGSVLSAPPTPSASEGVSAPSTPSASESVSAPSTPSASESVAPPEEQSTPEKDGPLFISSSGELQEELYAAISEVRQPLPMDAADMVWSQTPEIDVKNLYYELISRHPELKYAYDVAAVEENGLLTCQIFYMPHKTGDYPADWQGISVDTITELVKAAEEHLGEEPLLIRLTDPAFDPDQISYALRQVGGGYVLCGLNRDGTAITYSPAMGMTMADCLALLEQAEELASEIARALLDDNMTEREKAEILYRYLTENVKYDRQYYSDQANMSYDSRTAVGALRDGLAICGGYSNALKLLFEQADIPCYMVTGAFGSENHMWNIACLDGRWLWFDATADRGKSSQFELRYFAREELDAQYSWDREQLSWLSGISDGQF